MLTALDHVSVAVQDLDAATTTYPELRAPQGDGPLGRTLGAAPRSSP